MTAQTNPDNLRGALWMVAAMAGFAVEDMFLKSAARAMPLGQVLVIFGVIGVAFFAMLARHRGEAPFPAAALSRPMLIRGGFEVTGRLFYSLAIALTPLTIASAILQATPLVVVAGAAILFGEKVGWQRWLAIVAGFAGVMVILRPGVAGFDALSLLTVLGLIGFAGRDLATRAAPPAMSNVQLGVSGLGMLGVAGVILLVVQGGAVWPSAGGWVLAIGTAIFGITGYFCLTVAMRTGDVSAVTPFRYTRLVFAMILGVIVLGERPDLATLAGSAIVVGAGLYALLTGARR